MNDVIEVVVLVEGRTELIFVQQLLAPWLAQYQIYATAILVSKPGQKGGDVQFARVQQDIGAHLKQRSHTYITLMVDYYGLKAEWPGREKASASSTPTQKAHTLYQATTQKVAELFGQYRATERFIPYLAMHEFEALLFSDIEVLATQLNLSSVQTLKQQIKGVQSPEEINDSPHTAPSKRLTSLAPQFRKTTTGINIARAIGLPKIRQSCPLFNDWLTRLERLVPL